MHERWQRKTDCIALIERKQRPNLYTVGRFVLKESWVPRYNGRNCRGAERESVGVTLHQGRFIAVADVLYMSRPALLLSLFL